MGEHGVSSTISLDKPAFFILLQAMALAVEMNALQNNLCKMLPSSNINF